MLLEYGGYDTNIKTAWSLRDSVQKNSKNSLKIGKIEGVD
jgi:hypothetical protein